MFGTTNTTSPSGRGSISGALKASRGATTLPQTGDAALFTITGGRVVAA